MNTTDAYLIEIITQTSRYGCYLMDKESNVLMCKLLYVTPATLRKLYDTGLDSGYIKYEKPSFPWRIIPTDKGLAFAGITAESAVVS